MHTFHFIAQVGGRPYGGAAAEPISLLGLLVTVAIVVGIYRYFLRQAKRQQAKGGHPSTGRDA